MKGNKVFNFDLFFVDRLFLDLDEGIDFVDFFAALP